MQARPNWMIVLSYTLNLVSAQYKKEFHVQQMPQVQGGQESPQRRVTDSSSPGRVPEFQVLGFHHRPAMRSSSSRDAIVRRTKGSDARLRYRLWGCSWNVRVH